MKIYVFGSCSGTEPMPGRHHTSLAIEINDHLYFFDAGENCSHTAHLMGLDLLSVSDIFISHPHMDHVGGLPNLLWTIFKMTYVKGASPVFGDIRVHMSNKKVYDSMITILENTERRFHEKCSVTFKKIEEQVLHSDENIKVSAIHNNHMGPIDNEWFSYSFSIYAQNKKVVYSGDFKSLDDILPLIKDGCDLLFLETGHFAADNLCKEIVDGGYDIKQIYFMHHGRAILYDYETELEKCRKIIPDVKFTNDKDIITI